MLFTMAKRLDPALRGSPDGVFDRHLGVGLAQLRAGRHRLAVLIENSPGPAVFLVAQRIGERQFRHHGLALCIAAIL